MLPSKLHREIDQRVSTRICGSLESRGTRVPVRDIRIRVRLRGEFNPRATDEGNPGLCSSEPLTRLELESSSHGPRIILTERDDDRQDEIGGKRQRTGGISLELSLPNLPGRFTAPREIESAYRPMPKSAKLIIERTFISFAPPPLFRNGDI